MGVSQNRIDSLVELYIILFPEENEKSARTIIEDSRIGKAIIRHNQVVLHDDITANLCEILEETNGENEINDALTDKIVNAYDVFCERKKLRQDNSLLVGERVSASDRMKQRKLLKKYQEVKNQQKKSYMIGGKR